MLADLWMNYLILEGLHLIMTGKIFVYGLLLVTNRFRGRLRGCLYCLITSTGVLGTTMNKIRKKVYVKIVVVVIYLGRNFWGQLVEFFLQSTFRRKIFPRSTCIILSQSRCWHISSILHLSDLWVCSVYKFPPKYWPVSEASLHSLKYEVVASHFLFAKTSIFIICNDT